MTPPHIPGNEPDSNDMSLEPDVTGAGSNPAHDPAAMIEEEEAAKLGDFA